MYLKGVEIKRGLVSSSAETMTFVFSITMLAYPPIIAMVVATHLGAPFLVTVYYTSSCNVILPATMIVLSKGVTCKNNIRTYNRIRSRKMKMNNV